MSERKGCLYFCCAEEDSLYAIENLRQQKAAGELSEWGLRQLELMERRMAESCIDLIPAIIFASANQAGCREWIKKAGEEQQREWYRCGIAWMRRYPAFLEKFGWKERKNAILTAGILVRAEEGSWEGARQLMQGGWRFLWERMKQQKYLGIDSWKEMIAPWRDSYCMRCGMAGVLLFMAALLKKPVRDRDQLWHDLQRLRDFSKSSLEKPEPMKQEEQDPFADNNRMDWLLTHFRNPQRLSYVREKGRIDSEWMEQVFKIMQLAGLPVSACETMSLSRQEVQQILDTIEGKPTAKTYMTFLVLYTLSKELAQLGRIAAAQEIPGQEQL